MGRPKGSKNSGTTSSVPAPNPMLEALNFISVAFDNPTQPYHDFVKFENGFAMLSNGIITAGFPIEEQLDCYPHFETLHKAVKKMGKSTSMTLLDTNRLSVKGDNLRVLVPCFGVSEYPELVPDSPIAVIDDRLKEAFKLCGSLVSEKADRVVEAALLLEANQCTGTNGAVLMQYWHGIDLPPAMVVPKLFAQAVSKVKQPITAFGWTYEKSITFYFEGGMWIKCLMYADAYPDIQGIVDKPSFPSDVLEGFFEGIATVGEFSDDGYVYFADNAVTTHRNDTDGAQYDVKGLQAGKQFDSKQLALIAPYVKTIDLTTYPERIFFFGDNMRGVAIGVVSGG